MPWFKIKRNPISNDTLDSVIEVFEDFFKEWDETKDVFSDKTLISLEKPAVSAQLIQYKENKKDVVENLMKELREGLKYNFFSVFWQKKENLKLIRKLKDFLIKLDNESMKEHQEILNLEKNNKGTKDNGINQDNSTDFVSKNYFYFFNEKLNMNISYLKETNLNIFNYKKQLLTEFQELKKIINKEIQELYEKNEGLENQNNKIFEKLFKENIIANLILSFWALRMKNNGNKYELNLENKELKNKPNENFSFFFELIDIIFNRYIKIIIKNEEKIFNDIFNSYNDKKSDLINEQKEFTRNQNEFKDNIDKFNQNIKEENAKIIKNNKELEKKKMQKKSLEKRKKDIKAKKITYLEDLEQKKNNLDEIQILIIKSPDKKKAKKEYLQGIEKALNEITKDIKNKNNEITELEDNNIRNNAELAINNKNWNEVKENIEKNQTSFNNNKYMMIYELKKIKKIWIKKISEDQKKFFNFLANFNKLEDIKFVDFIENFWKIEENKTIFLTLNKEYDIENNMKTIEELNKAIENKFKNNFEKLKINFEGKETEIIANAIKDLKESFQETLKIINKSEFVSVETQTGISQENNLSWQEQKYAEQNEKIEELQSQVEYLQKTLVLIKEEHEDECEGLSKKVNNIGEIIQIQYKTNVEECEQLKNNMKSKNLKETEIRIIANKLNETEIAVICLEKLKNLVNNPTQKEELQIDPSKSDTSVLPTTKKAMRNGSVLC